MTSVHKVAPLQHRSSSAASPPTLREGAHGAAVNKLQQALLNAGFNPHGVDGHFGPKTRAAVLAFQRAHGLKPDGVVGPITWGALLSTQSGGSSSPPPQGSGGPSSAGWTGVSHFVQDYQNNGHDCGPSSLQMMFSELVGSKKLDETQFARWGGTDGNGTSPAGMFAAARTGARQLGFSLATSQRSIQSVGWARLAQMIADPKVGVVMHIRTGGLPNWKNDYGHYVYPIGVDLSRKLVKIADPTKGICTYTFAQYERAMARAGSASLLVFERR